MDGRDHVKDAERAGSNLPAPRRQKGWMRTGSARRKSSSQEVLNS